MKGKVYRTEAVFMSDNKETKNKKKLSFGAILCIVLCCALFVGLAGSGVYQAVKYYNSVNAEAAAVSDNTAVISDNNVIQTGSDENITPTPETLTVSSDDLSSLVKNVMPAIVIINCKFITVESDMFGRQTQYETSGSASGIIIGESSTELLIVTNAHVVEDATQVVITIADGTEFEASIKGIDTYSDLAVVSIPMKQLSDDNKANIKIALLGDSTTVETGAMSIAIGNALGYGQSVTVGYISAVNRDVTIDGVTRQLIQTDAAINPGNSGGALLSDTGLVIGINSVKYASSDVEGMGYAIPISDAIPIINDLMNREELSESETGYLGIEGKDVSDSYSESFGIPVGIYINRIYSDSPAEEAGLSVGNIITGINGRTVTTKEELQAVLDYTRAGTTVTLQVYVLEGHGYVEKDITVTLGSR